MHRRKEQQITLFFRLFIMSPKRELTNKKCCRKWLNEAYIIGLFLVLGVAHISAQSLLVGKVSDKETNEPLVGATVTYSDGKGTVTDFDGLYSLSLQNGKYTITVNYIGYKIARVEVVVTGQKLENNFELEPDNASLSMVTVVAQSVQNNEVALLKRQQESLVTMTTVSEQQIKRTQDKDASEVVRRIPGVSIIDEKFVMVRGLSQRYNNVWLNGSAVPSSEADQRAFSFDIIPSSQIDNMKVVKSSSPEFPSDFTGGFITISTKDVPLSNSWDVSVGGSYNSKTHFRSHLSYKGSDTDFLGFDNGKRNLKNGINSILSPQNNGFSLLNNRLNNDWTVTKCTPVADVSFASSVSHRWHTDNGYTLGLNGSINYGNSHRTILDIKNNMFGAYDVTHDCSNYLRRAQDDQYSQNVKLGALLGLTWLSPESNHRIELKQLLNQLGKSRYTYRRGYDAQSDYQEQAEYYYQSRCTYNVGLSGKHNLSESDILDWNAGYAYANRNLPDRRRYCIVEQVEGNLEIENLNDVNREFSYLKEHIFSVGSNFSHKFDPDFWIAKINTGVYGEYKSRRYDTRLFTYAWPNGQLPEEMRLLDVPTQLLVNENYGLNGLYLLEQVDWSNNYEANNKLGCGYVAILVPLFNKRLEAYGGLRFESSHTELISHTRRQKYSPLSTTYNYDNLFPSINLTCHLSPKHQIRMAYGRTTNRPEFRELSTSVYYDFDLASNVQGNHNLSPSYIDNIDLGWECFPNAGEIVSLSLFYKRFNDPIEWTYTVAGGTDLIYSYMNAMSATNYGLEVDLRKQLDFIGMQLFSLSLNASLIKSSVDFQSDSHERDRPMQGQSPYLVNVGLFFNSDLAETSGAWSKGWTAAILYNTIGKRLIGVGRSVGNSDTDVRVPDSYEMPRHLVDFNVGKSFGKFSMRFSVRDIFANKVLFKQLENTVNGKVEQITRSFSPGRTLSFNVSYKI